MSLPIVSKYGITVEKRDAKIKEFEKYVKSLNKQIQTETVKLYNESQKGDDAFQTDLKKTTHFYYFIGRLNPPHQGHMTALNTLVQTANQKNSVPLILLGSGPGGERTLDNPITYELKSNFIRSKLPGNYILKEMKNPAADVSEYIKTSLKDKSSPVENVQITHVAGDKAEDSTKLNFIKPIAYNAASIAAKHANVQIDTEAIAAVKNEGIEMSATRVRQDAYRCFIDGSGETGFTEKYGWFYQEFVSDIYQQIVEPAKELPEEQISEYIATGVLNKTRKRKPSPKTKSKTTRKKGGRKNRSYRKK
jgi:nicotinamide mononucleotide adenylyltransferase